MPAQRCSVAAARFELSDTVWLPPLPKPMLIISELNNVILRRHESASEARRRRSVRFRAAVTIGYLVHLVTSLFDHPRRRTSDPNVLDVGGKSVPDARAHCKSPPPSRPLTYIDMGE